MRKDLKMTKRIISLLCAVTLLMGMCSMFALAANPVHEGIDIDRAKIYQTDLSIMSLNVMECNDGNNTHFDTADNRLEYILTIIETYSPDIIGVQEASMEAASGTGPFSDGGNWHTKLTTRMGNLGYEFRSLNQDTNGLTTRITNGLIVFYKKNRFTYKSSSAIQLTVSGITAADDSGSYSNTPITDRYCQRVELEDKGINDKHAGQRLFFYNTHLAIDLPTALSSLGTTVNVSDDIKAEIGRKVRTKQIDMIKADMDTKSSAYPVIAVGDFNANYKGCYTDNAATQPRPHNESALLHLFDNNLSNGTDVYYDAARMAKHQVATDYLNTVDRIFYNNAFIDNADFRTIRENVEGRMIGDHYPVLAQMSYRAITSAFGPGKYDISNGVYTDTVDESEYTFEITTSAPFSVKIMQGSTQCPNTVALNKTTNKFDINFYIGNQLYDTIPATIHYTGADKPVIQTENAVNHYFANNSYHVVVANETENIIIRPVGGTLYKDKDGTIKQDNRITKVDPGKTTYYLKENNNGEIFPVYVYKETKPAFKSEMVLYIDDDFGSAVGTVAFWDGKDVSLVTANKNAFDSFDDINKFVDNKDGYTVYVAPGEYVPIAAKSKDPTSTNESYTSVNSDAFNRSLTILGPNHDIEPNVRDMDGTWTLNNNRRDEAIIRGMLSFWPGSGNSDLKEIQITVKGLKFEGKTRNGSLRIYDDRGISTNDRTAVQVRTEYVTNLDIENNIFTASGYYFNAAAIYANNSSQKTGVIANNYFKSVAERILDERDPGETQSESNDYYRGIFMRNLNGLIIDGNRFVDISTPFWFSSEIQDVNESCLGNLSYTVQDNRFENCGAGFLAATNLAEGVDNNAADIRYYNNDFLRCGNAVRGAAILISITEHYSAKEIVNNLRDSVAMDYSKINIHIQGNNFYDCYKSIRIYRGTHERDHDKGEYFQIQHHGDVNDMTLKIVENRFVNPNEDDASYTTLQNTIDFAFFLTPEIFNGETDDRELSAKAKAKWKLSHNYFTSPILTQGTKDQTTATGRDVTTSVHDPKYFVRNSVNTYDGSNYIRQGVSFTWEDGNWDNAFAPYYLDYDLETLSNSSSAAPMTGITAVGYTDEYDHQPHSITVNLPDQLKDAIVSYSLDDERDESLKAYSAHNPTFTDVCEETTVYYKVEKVGYKPHYGYATVEITPNADPRDILADNTVTYEYGKLYSPILVSDPAHETEAHYVYTYNGETYDEMPAFTEVGTYKVDVTVTSFNHMPISDSATLTIEKADLEDYNISGGYVGTYDGNKHTISASLPRDVTPLYSINGGEWTDECPSFKDVTDGPVTVDMKMENHNYVSRNESFTFNITPAAITDVSVEATTAVENGLPLDLLTVVAGTETTKNLTTVAYAVNGHDFTATKPAFTKAGTYTVAVKFTRPNYQEKVIVKNVTVGEYAGIEKNFALDMKQTLIQNQNFMQYVQPSALNKFTLTFGLTLAWSEAGENTAMTTDFKILAFGIKYASTEENLENYAFYQKHAYNYDANGKLTENSTKAAANANALITGKKVVEYVYDSDDAGLYRLYRDNVHNIFNTQPLKARYSMMFVRYSIDGNVYEEYSPIASAATLLGDEHFKENGFVTGMSSANDYTVEFEDALFHLPN